MYYPKELFVAREDVTRNNIKKYEKMKENWYKKALELYPNYYEMKLKDRIKCRGKINEAVGYSI